ncbi:uncharacterized protein TM35_000021790 [Trypanosoma theileri]|uniref:Uncharacterized protein n=1 Tax=Trypanosoma theileri TaxID=67003 RepID=A0A1X0P899_9TRYP|nr:uncharacterized protein TM35_000021790 [Trypanosoma theileri]ORC92853.1 hypothetical protein TM35_000021790 [Trypanosoma theileri]
MEVYGKKVPLSVVLFVFLLFYCIMQQLPTKVRGVFIATVVLAFLGTVLVWSGLDDHVPFVRRRIAESRSSKRTEKEKKHGHHHHHRGSNGESQEQPGEQPKPQDTDPHRTPRGEGQGVTETSTSQHSGSPEPRSQQSTPGGSNRRIIIKVPTELRSSIHSSLSPCRETETDDHN